MRKTMAVALAATFLWAAAAGAADVVEDLSKTEGIQAFAGPEGAKALLKKNGFVVVPRYHKQIFSPYIRRACPPFVTTDSLHRTFHLIFEEQLKIVEGELAGHVAEMTGAMKKRLRKMAEQANASDLEHEAAVLAVGYFEVADHLLRGAEPTRDLYPSSSGEAGSTRSPVHVPFLKRGLSVRANSFLQKS